MYNVLTKSGWDIINYGDNSIRITKELSSKRKVSFDIDVSNGLLEGLFDAVATFSVDEYVDVLSDINKLDNKENNYKELISSAEEVKDSLIEVLSNVARRKAA